MIDSAKKVECEVLVIGGGASGTMTAINAHDAGADVLIVEKLPELGGNCHICGGNIMTPTDLKFTEYLNTIAFKTVDHEIIDLFVKEAMNNADWIKKLGGDVIRFEPLQVVYPGLESGAGFPRVPGAQYMVKLNVKEREGEELSPGQRLWKLLKENVEKRGIRTITHAPVKRLVKNEQGEVIGAIAEKDKEEFFIKAKRAVVLTTGGYENDPATLWEYYPCRPICFLGSPGNTGDGVRLAQKVGAAMWHMTNMVCTIGFKAPEYPAAFSIVFYTPEFIFVDKYGKRFMRETGIDVHEYGRAFSYFDTDIVEHPRLPSWCIFSERNRRMGPLYTGGIGSNKELYKWSEDNEAEIARGWIVKAKSFAELAGKIQVDTNVLSNTISTYNAYCKNGKDAEFARPKEHLVPLEKPPFYAIKVMPALYCTQGGPKRDKNARVLDIDGNPIPRLYASGELGSVNGFMYQGGANLSESIVFSKIAARNAVAEEMLQG